MSFLHYHLILLGLPAMGATTTGDAVHLMQSVGAGDMVIAISFRRGLRQTVEGLRQARTNGAYCVGIADTLISLIAGFADECFLVSVDTPSFGASYTGPMYLLNGILISDLLDFFVNLARTEPPASRGQIREPGSPRETCNAKKQTEIRLCERVGQNQETAG